MQMTDRQKKIWGIATIIGLVVFMGLLCWFVGRPMIRFVSEPEKFRLWVDEHGIWGRLAFIGMVIFQIIVAIIPGEPLEIGAGYAFGAVEGTILCLTGAVLGGAIVVLLVRRYGIKLVEVFFPKEKIMSLRFMQDSRRLELLVFIVFMIPGTPKDLLCYAVGLTNLRMRDWLWISLVARIPSVITSTIGGNALGEQNYVFAAAVFAVTLLISLGGILLYGKVTMENAPANALGAVVYLGYYESADAMKAELPEVLKDLPLAEMGGGEAYAIIPRFEGESVTLYAVTMKENATAERAENGTAYDGAVLLMCNESDIFTNTEVELKLGEDSISFGPYISLMDGSVVTHDRVPVGMIQ